MPKGRWFGKNSIFKPSFRWMLESLCCKF
jgi:hypothetical protein